MLSNDTDIREEIEKAVAVLRSGGIILYPTDTVWGVGCDATNEQAVAKVYTLKKSENKHGMIALMENADSVARYFGRLPDVAWELFECASSPLTLILAGAGGVAPNLLSGDEKSAHGSGIAALRPESKTLAVRIPDHEFCRRLLHRLGRPLVSTSANISGEPAPRSFGDIDSSIKEGVDMVIDPRFEGNPTRKASSIIKLGPGGEVEIIR